ncbi:protein arginine N-methyltransferase 1 [Venturia canescens]|uniref:protein arginine N-methyltransferase 1 n=1 Tax=Venturia canescens TaxID=32260 RepID=UPI001C9D2187|nr:protein arginine N-methyltransferase 1 [Venturia canescens]
MTEEISGKVDKMELEASDCDSSDDWDEGESTHCGLITCLFCKEEFKLYIEATLHLQTAHNFNLAKVVRKLGLDDYTYRKLVNYIRLENSKPSDIMNMKDGQAWESNEYLKPVVQDDGWLMLDIEDIVDDRGEKDEERPSRQTAYPVNSENGCVTLSETHFAELQRTIQSLKAQLEQREIVCFLAKQQIEEMQLKVKSIVLDDDNDKDRTSKSVKSIRANDDDGYFSTYSHFAIHHEMLTDTVRTETYRDALLTNSNMFSNCVMLDVGCGTGILSMFAAKSGCRKVISVDQSDVIYHAMDIVRENNLDDIIQLKKGRLEDIDLGVEKVDAIVSEWMGYFLLFEGMLDTIIYARDHYLVPGGKLLPSRCTLSIVGSGDTKRYIDLVDYWSNVYGFKMSCMKAKVVKEPSIEISNVKDLVTNITEIQAFDLYSVDTNCVNFTAPFEFTITKTGSLTAIVGYFDVFFNGLDNPISFSTGPHAPATHWKQTVFSLTEPISITEGEVICGKLICRRHVKDVRGLIVTICIKNISQVYYLD